MKKIIFLTLLTTLLFTTSVFAEGIPVLMYHGIVTTQVENEYQVNTIDFNNQMNYLKSQGYNTISCSEYFLIMNGYLKVNKPIMITMDDGWTNQYLNARPILNRYRYKATYFIVSNFIGKKLYMNRNQIRNLKVQDNDIQCHSLNHEDLSLLSYKKQRRNIKLAKQVFRKKLGFIPNYFCLPYGAFNDNTILALQNNNFKLCFSSEWGINYTNNYLVNRLCVSGYLTLDQFKNLLN